MIGHLEQKGALALGDCAVGVRNCFPGHSTGGDRHTGTALRRGLQGKARMENQELEKEMRSMWGSLNGLSWPISRSSLAETVASLEPELLQWASPIEISAESTHVPLVDLISAPGLIDQSVTAMELSASAPSSGLCTLAVLSLACSLDLESCEAATSRGTIAAADLRILDERAGSTDSNKSYAFAAALPAGASLPDHSPDPPRTPQPVQPSARTMAMLQKNRRQQKEHNQRKRARNLAVHANVETLKERKAALEQDMGALLTQHEQLTRQQPWARQHEEVHFIASITTLMPAPADKCGSKETAQGRDLLSRLMLDPTATMESLCKPASHANSLAAMKACATAERQPPSMQQPYTEWGLADSDSIAWSSILACLRLSKVQKDDIVALYENHLQEMAALQQDCLDVAYKLQGLHHCVAGELTDCAWPNMVTHLVSAQLAGIAGREQEMIRCLTCACHKVLDTAQQRNLALLAPAAAADLRALCREVSGSCRPPRKAPASAPAERPAPAENALPAPPAASPAAGPTLLAARALPATSVAGTAAAFGIPQQVPSTAPQKAGCCMISAVVEAPVVGTVFRAEAKLAKRQHSLHTSREGSNGGQRHLRSKLKQTSASTSPRCRCMLPAMRAQLKDLVGT
ncbi:hypothetical protein WJX75_004450 [Coccomyxa subellipsoidea]|uniref:BZIP domain-containing protein n=1 Tax=Coccomyxa subellipsoidea TaxID=248742 RepID=A0ABR2YCY3_9CHLO